MHYLPKNADKDAKMAREKYLSFSTVLSLLAGAVMLGCGRKPAPVAEKPVPVSVFAAAVRQVKTVVDVAGRVEPQNRISVYSQVAGKVSRVAVQEGDRIGRHGLLAEVSQDAPGSDYRPHPVRSPIAGTVLRTMASLGASVGQQTPLFEIGDTKCIKFVGQIFGEEREAVRPGQRMIVTGAGGDTLMGLKIGRLAPQLDPSTGGQGIEATICLVKNPLIIGQSVDGHIEVGSVSGIAVPRLSLAKDADGNQGVYQARGDSAVFRRVRVVHRAQDYFLVEGIDEGTTVVAEGASVLAPGRKLSIVGGFRP